VTREWCTQRGVFAELLSSLPSASAPDFLNSNINVELPRRILYSGQHLQLSSHLQSVGLGLPDSFLQLQRHCGVYQLWRDSNHLSSQLWRICIIQAQQELKGLADLTGQPPTHLKAQPGGSPFASLAEYASMPSEESAVPIAASDSGASSRRATVGKERKSPFPESRSSPYCPKHVTSRLSARASFKLTQHNLRVD
jgi:hypothetical protein